MSPDLAGLPSGNPAFFFPACKLDLAGRREKFDQL
jgi:hypothetical protein